jgi:hypothetical protein
VTTGIICDRCGKPTETPACGLSLRLTDASGTPMFETMEIAGRHADLCPSCATSVLDILSTRVVTKKSSCFSFVGVPVVKSTPLEVDESQTALDVDAKGAKS